MKDRYAAKKMAIKNKIARERRGAIRRVHAAVRAFFAEPFFSDMPATGRASSAQVLTDAINTSFGPEYVTTAIEKRLERAIADAITIRECRDGKNCSLLRGALVRACTGVLKAYGCYNHAAPKAVRGLVFRT